ncbi:MAG: 16S rRNA (guanine(527)-N(7))-methyltransferase RsmG [Firmicutes bacterium]|nr:16S rRNA (guanine(527)-N(7))-methyltransferase RsmG [Bacillota bacterium]
MKQLVKQFFLCYTAIDMDGNGSILLLKSVLGDYNLSESAIGQMSTHFNLLLEESARMNLTAIKCETEIAKKHFADSLSALKHIENGYSVLDIGSGAGFPALPLASCVPNAHFTLLDATKKKTAFIDSVIAKSGLKNAKTLNARAEEVAHRKELRESFNIVLARAVSPLSILVELCVPFLKPNGTFIAYKSGDTAEEIKEATSALTALNAEIVAIETFSLLGEFGRTLILIKRKGKLDKIYPRAYAKITAKPKV